MSIEIRVRGNFIFFQVCSFLFFFSRKKKRNEPKKRKIGKNSSVASRRKIKWKYLKAEPSTFFARYHGKAARSPENPPALGATSCLVARVKRVCNAAAFASPFRPLLAIRLYKGGFYFTPFVKGGRGDLFRPTCGRLPNVYEVR